MDLFIPYPNKNRKNRPFPTLTMPTYVHHHNQRLGPLDDNEVFASLQNNTFSPNDLAWRDGMADWQPLRNLYPSAGLPDSQTPPPLPQTWGAPPSPPRLGDDAGMRLLLPVGRSGWAIAAGYLGLFALILLPAPVALLVSLIAIVDIQRSRASAQPKYGMGRAIFGLVTGLAGTALLLYFLLAR